RYRDHQRAAQKSSVAKYYTAVHSRSTAQLTTPAGSPAEGDPSTPAACPETARSAPGMRADGHLERFPDDGRVNTFPRPRQESRDGTLPRSGIISHTPVPHRSSLTHPTDHRASDTAAFTTYGTFDPPTRGVLTKTNAAVPPAEGGTAA